MFSVWPPSGQPLTAWLSVHPPHYSLYTEFLNSGYEMESFAYHLLYLEDHADKPPHKNTPGATDCLQRNLWWEIERKIIWMFLYLSTIYFPRYSPSRIQIGYRSYSFSITHLQNVIQDTLDIYGNTNTVEPLIWEYFILFLHAISRVLAIIQIEGLIRCTPIFCGRPRDAECYDIISIPWYDK